MLFCARVVISRGCLKRLIRHLVISHVKVVLEPRELIEIALSAIFDKFAILGPRRAIKIELNIS
jgi:hypothetical protein